MKLAFEHLGLEAFPKTSGSKGMQVDLPLNTPGITYADTREFSRGLAQLLERRDPKRVVSDMSKAKRTGQGVRGLEPERRHKTTVNVYSLRAMERPTVSTPLSWDEVSDLGGRLTNRCRSRRSEVLERVASLGDRFAPVQTLEQDLPR